MKKTIVPCLGMYTFRLSVAMLFLMLVSCNTLDTRSEPTGQSDVRQTKPTWMVESVSTERPALPNPVMQEAETSDAELSELRSRRFSMVLRDAELSDALITIARDSSFNLILHPNIKGKVTVDLKNVTLEEALNTLLEPNGCCYRVQGSMLHIEPNQLETRNLNLNYPATHREGTRELNISGRSTDIRQVTYLSAISELAEAVKKEGAKSAPQVQGEERNVTSIKSYSDVDFWHDISSALGAIVFGEKGKIPDSADKAQAPKAVSLSDEKGRRLVINPTAGSVLVRAFPDEIEEVETFAALVQEAVNRQVLIEARIFEVKLENEFDLGVNWAANLEDVNTGNFRGTLNSGGLTDAMIAQTLGLTAPILKIGVTNDELSVTIDALARNGRLNLLSAPRISALNNQLAAIRIVREEVFFTPELAPIFVTSGVTVTTQPIFTPQIIPVGIILDVTPQISENGIILMDIHPRISEIVGEVTSPKGDKQPIINVRELNTVTRVRNNETIVIAGLMQDRNGNTHTYVPVLGKLPLLGPLFSKTEKDSSKTELVILITPRILTLKNTAEISEKQLGQVGIESGDGETPPRLQ